MGLSVAVVVAGVSVGEVGYGQRLRLAATFGVYLNSIVPDGPPAVLLHGEPGGAGSCVAPALSTGGRMVGRIGWLMMVAVGLAGGVARAEVAGPWVAGFYVGWNAAEHPPSAVDYASLSHVMVFSLQPRADGTLDTTLFLDDINGPKVAREVADRAHAAGRIAILVVGGEGRRAHSRARPAPRTWLPSCRTCSPPRRRGASTASTSTGSRCPRPTTRPCCRSSATCGRASRTCW